MPARPRGPSPHLSWKEVHCWDRRVRPWRLLAVYPIDWRETRLPVLALAFEAVRAGCGGLPIVPSSAYRTPDYNSDVGGGRKSQHVQGRALDLPPPSGWTVHRFYDEIVRIAQTTCPAIRGIGLYAAGPRKDHFVHIDVRPVEQLVRWEGKRPQAEVV